MLRISTDVMASLASVRISFRYVSTLTGVSQVMEFLLLGSKIVGFLARIKDNSMKVLYFVTYRKSLNTTEFGESKIPC